MDRTLIIIKPDAVSRGLIGAVISRFEEAGGLKLVALKMAVLDDAVIKDHYAHLTDKPFFPGLVAFMKSTPVVLAVLQGENAVDAVRGMCGPTDSKKAPPGTIRGDYGTDVQQNIVHASDSKETAEQEIARFFSPAELFA